MTVYEWGALIVAVSFGLAGMVTGFVSLRQSNKANLAAKKAAEEAEVSNRIAADALKKAAEANEIAEDANKLSQDANALVGRSVSQQEEDWFVDWTPYWEEQRSVLSLVNTGRDNARRVTVIIKGENLHQLWNSQDDVGPGEQATIAVPQIGQERSEHDAEDAAAAISFRGSGIFFSGSTYTKSAAVTVRWRTGLGFPASKLLEVTFS